MFFVPMFVGPMFSEFVVTVLANYLHELYNGTLHIFASEFHTWSNFLLCYSLYWPYFLQV